MKLNIVVLTGNSHRHHFFARQILACGHNTKVFFNCKKPPSRPQVLSRKASIVRFLRKLRVYSLNLAFRPFLLKFQRLKSQAEHSLLASAPYDFGSDHIILHPEERINQQKYVNYIKNLKPDLILVFGAEIISKDIIELSPCSLNLHTGVSPFFRGNYCNLFSVLSKNFTHVGSTIHLLDTSIDNGRLIKRFIIKSDAINFFHQNSSSILQATKFISQCLHSEDPLSLFSYQHTDSLFTLNGNQYLESNLTINPPRLYDNNHSSKPPFLTKSYHLSAYQMFLYLLFFHKRTQQY